MTTLNVNTINRGRRSSPRLFSKHQWMVVLVEILIVTLDLQGTLAVRRDRPAEPKFAAAIGSKTFTVGGEGKLTCRILHITSHKVGWKRESDQIILSVNQLILIPDNRFRILYRDPFIWELRISNLKKSDSGCYLCMISTRDLKSQIGCITVKDPEAEVHTDYSAFLPPYSLTAIVVACAILMISIIVYKKFI